MLTVQLAEAGFPTVVALNMADEAAGKGIDIDESELSELLGTPAVKTVATTGEGFNELEREVFSARVPDLNIEYPEPIRSALEDVSSLLGDLDVTTKASGLGPGKLRLRR